VTAQSAYREVEARFGPNSDALWEYLEAHRLDDPTLTVGWALLKARRYFGWDNATVAQKTAITNARGQVIEEPLSKTFISSMLSGKSKAAPNTYVRLARVCEVSPLDFYLAEGWLDPGDIAAYDLPDKETALPVMQRLLALPQEVRPKARAVVLSILDSVYDVETSRHANDGVNGTSNENALLERTASGERKSKKKTPTA
jgi:hypothetical protein